MITKIELRLLVTTGFMLGILALIAMRNSWRVGIKYDQKTDLVISGIYRFSRNPYFLPRWRKRPACASKIVPLFQLILALQ